MYRVLVAVVLAEVVVEVIVEVVVVALNDIICTEISRSSYSYKHGYSSIIVVVAIGVREKFCWGS